MTQSRTHSPRSVPSDLGFRAGRGFIWHVICTVGAKFISAISQIVLAWFLVPEDFGAVGMAWTVLAIATLVQNIGLQDVLIQRHAHIHRWANPAFWMALTAGCAAVVIALAAIPIARHLYGEPRLPGLIAVLSLSLPLRALLIVPQAHLSGTLRFRTDAALQGIVAVATVLSSVILAAMGFGPYAMVIPVPLVLACHVAVAWWIAGISPRFALQIRRWRLLIGDTGYAWGVMAMIAVTLYVDYTALSVFHPARVVGVYFVAFNLSTQVFTLLVTSLMSVLLPSLSLLADDAKRQSDSFVRATRLVVAIGLPACVGVAAIAMPLIRLLYKPEYVEVGALLATLAVGMGMYLPAGTATSLLRAQARFRTLFFAYGAMAATMTALLFTVAGMSHTEDAAQNAAYAVASVYFCFGPIFLAIAVRRLSEFLRVAFSVYAVPVVASAISIGAGLAAAEFIARDSDLARLVVVPCIAVPCYIACVWVMSRELCRMIIDRLVRRRAA